MTSTEKYELYPQCLAGFGIRNHGWKHRIKKQLYLKIGVQEVLDLTSTPTEMLT